MCSPADSKWKKKSGKKHVAGTKKRNQILKQLSIPATQRELEGIENKTAKPGFNVQSCALWFLPLQRISRSASQQYHISFSQFDGANSLRKTSIDSKVCLCTISFIAICH